MYCHRCGAQIPDRSAFCSQCGAALSEETGGAQKKGGAGTQTTPGKKRGFSSKLIKCILIVIVIAALAALAVNWMKHRTVAELPDPRTYFSAVAHERDYNTEYRITLSSDEDFFYAVEAYVDLLLRDYPFKLTTSDVNASGNQCYYMGYTGSLFLTMDLNNGPDTLCLEYSHTKDAYVLTVRNRESSHLAWKPLDTYSASGGGSVSGTPDGGDWGSGTVQGSFDGLVSNPPEGGSVLPADPNSAVLPDPGLFLSCGRGEDMSYTTHDSDGWLVSYSFDMGDGEAAQAEYRALLEDGRYQLECVDSITEDYISSSARLWNVYYYQYTGGNPAVSEIEDWRDNRGDVILSIGYYHDWDSISLSLYYSSAFTLEDSGSKASKAPADYSGNPVSGGESSSGSGVYIPEFAKKDCSICKGSGDCQVCGGDGYLWSSAADKENRYCWNCHTHNGKCPYCNGTGKQR